MAKKFLGILKTKTPVWTVAKDSAILGGGLGVFGWASTSVLGPFIGPLLAGTLGGAFIGGDVGKTISILTWTETISTALGSQGLIQ